MPTNKRLSKLPLVVMLGLLGGSVCWLAISFRFHRSFAYRGKPLEYWFNQLPLTRIGGEGPRDNVHETTRLGTKDLRSGSVREYGSWLEAPEVSMKAIQSVGRDGIEFYLSKLRRHKRPIENKVQRAAFALGLRRFLFEDTNAEREQAVTALILLKPLPPEVVSELATLSTNRDREIATAARSALTIKESELVLQYHPDSKRSLDNHSLDINQLNLPSLSDDK